MAALFYDSGKLPWASLLPCASHYLAKNFFTIVHEMLPPKRNLDDGYEGREVELNS